MSYGLRRSALLIGGGTQSPKTCPATGLISSIVLGAWVSIGLSRGEPLARDRWLAEERAGIRKQTRQALIRAFAVIGLSEICRLYIEHQQKQLWVLEYWHGSASLANCPGNEWLMLVPHMVGIGYE